MMSIEFSFIPFNLNYRLHMLKTKLLLLTLSYLVSLLIFQRGILTRRRVLNTKSACLDIPRLRDEANNFCWLDAKPTFNRAILIIIDALSYAFIDPITNNTILTRDETNYRGQMPRINELLQKFPGRTRLLPLVADAPTTTYQRIKAIVTGSIPAFIEAGENFGGSEIIEDNLIDQLVRLNKNAVLIGDETWLRLLPHHFIRNYTAPSFDIKDLDTVDDLVTEKIFSEIARSDWTFLMAHCLGVDHCGHRYHRGHSEMKRKLRQMDDLIYDLTRELPDDCLLLVIGDHGMTFSGDHGGDHADEVTTALFAFANQDFPPLTNLEEIKQVDIVPTIASILDVPIPFSNLGRVIYALIGEANYRTATRLNVFQLLRYAWEYSRYDPSIQDKLRMIVRLQQTLPDDDIPANKYIITEIQKLLRSVFTVFYWEVMALGLFSLFESLLFNLTLAINPSKSITLTHWVFRSALLLLQFSILSSSYPLNRDLIIFVILSLSLSVLNHTMQLIFYFVRVSRNDKIWTSFSIGISGFLGSLSFSNSYIIYESSILRFIIQTLFLFGWFTALNRIRFAPNKQRTVKSRFQIALGIILTNKDSATDFLSMFLLMIIIRIAALFEQCREEQVECSNSYAYYVFGSDMLFSLSTAGLFLHNFYLYYLSNTSRTTTSSVNKKLITSALSWSSILLVMVHWLFERAISENGTSNRSIDQISRYCAVAVYVFWCLHFLLSLIVKVSGADAHDLWLQNYQMLVIPITMILGQRIALIFILFSFVLIITFQSEMIYSRNWLYPLFAHLVSSLCFYASSHQMTLNSIPWNAAFVGLPGNFQIIYLPGALILINLFAGKLLAVELCLLRSKNSYEGASLFQFLFIVGLKVLGSTVACTIHRKHIMFFKVFAPFFVFESIGLLVCCIFSFISSVNV